VTLSSQRLSSGLTSSRPRGEGAGCGRGGRGSIQPRFGGGVEGGGSDGSRPRCEPVLGACIRISRSFALCSTTDRLGYGDRVKCSLSECCSGLLGRCFECFKC